MSENNTFRYPHPVHYFGSKLFQVCHFTEQDLQNYKNYDSYTENNLARSISNTTKELNSILDKNPESRDEDYSGFFSEELHEYGNFFPHLHRKSMVITLFNFYEHQIETLCLEVKKLLAENITENYFNNTCLKSFRRFLQREAKFNIVQGNELWRIWEDMLKVEEIRHVFVHSEGEIDNNKSRPLSAIKNYCKCRKNIRLCGYRIIIEEGFVGALITDMIRIFKLLTEETNYFIKCYADVYGSYEYQLPPGASKTPL